MEALGAALLMFLLAVAIVGGLGALIWWSVQTEKKRVAVWRALAARVRAQFVEPQGGFFTRRPCMIFLERDGALVWLDTYVVSHGKSSTAYTRCRAEFVLGVGPVFRVYREGMLSSLGKALGTQDVELGVDPAFDAHFMVKADDPASTRLALPAYVQQLLRVQHATSWLQSDGKTATLTWLGLERNPDRLQAALECLASVARYRLDWLDVVAAVPGARPVPASGQFGKRRPPSFLLDVGGAPVRVFPTLHNVTPVLRVHAPSQRATASMRAWVAAGRVDPAALAPGLLGGPALEALAPLGDGQLAAEPGELWLDLHGAATPDRVEAAARAIASIAVGGDAPFR